MNPETGPSGDGPTLRWNRLGLRWVIVSPQRALRLGAVDAMAERDLESELCVLCPGQEHRTPPELARWDEPWTVRAVPNLYPVLAPCEGSMRFVASGDRSDQPGCGIHEVLVLSPDHDADWSGFDDPHLETLTIALVARLEAHTHQEEVAYTQAYVNHGAAAGASLAHPHAQLVGLPFVPPEVEREAESTSGGGSVCALCAAITSGEGAALHHDGVLALVPRWAESPHEVVVLPIAHSPRIHEGPLETVAGVGRMIRDVLGLLMEHLSTGAYNLVFHTGPHRLDRDFHWHVHVRPKLTVPAGFEMGTGVAINVVRPEETVELLRARGR